MHEFEIVKRQAITAASDTVPTLLRVILTASSRIHGTITLILENPQLNPEGFIAGCADSILGLLYRAKKKRALALEHLTEAERVLSEIGQTPTLARVDAALAELGQ